MKSGAVTTTAPAGDRVSGQSSQVDVGSDRIAAVVEHSHLGSGQIEPHSEAIRRYADAVPDLNWVWSGADEAHGLDHVAGRTHNAVNRLVAGSRAAIHVDQVLVLSALTHDHDVAVRQILPVGDANVAVAVRVSIVHSGHNADRLAILAQ